MNLHDLREANNQRQAEWPGSDKADIAFRTIEIAGEVGELCEAVKKYLRAERGIAGTGGTLEQIAEEMADAIISIDVMAMQLGIDLCVSVPKKFNKPSKKYGLSIELPPFNDGGEL